MHASFPSPTSCEMSMTSYASGRCRPQRATSQEMRCHSSMNSIIPCLDGPLDPWISQIRVCVKTAREHVNQRGLGTASWLTRRQTNLIHGTALYFADAASRPAVASCWWVGLVTVAFLCCTSATRRCHTSLSLACGEEAGDHGFEALIASYHDVTVWCRVPALMGVTSRPAFYLFFSFVVSAGRR